MRVIESLPPRPLENDEVEDLQHHDAVDLLAPVSLDEAVLEENKQVHAFAVAFDGKIKAVSLSGDGWEIVDSDTYDQNSTGGLSLDDMDRLNEMMDTAAAEANWV